LIVFGPRHLLHRKTKPPDLEDLINFVGALLAVTTATQSPHSFFLAPEHLDIIKLAILV